MNLLVEPDSNKSKHPVNNAGQVYNTVLKVYLEYGHTVTYAEYDDLFPYLFEDAISRRYWRIFIVKQTALGERCLG